MCLVWPDMEFCASTQAMLAEDFSTDGNIAEDFVENITSYLANIHHMKDHYFFNEKNRLW